MYYVISTIIILLYVILIILLINKKENGNIIRFSLSSISWQIGLVLMTYISDTGEDKYLYLISKLVFVSATSIFINLARFIETFLEKNKITIFNNSIIYYSFIIGFNSIILFSNLIVREVSVVGSGKFKGVYGAGYNLWLIIVALILIYIIYSLVYKHINIKGRIEKKQYHFVEIGLIISLVLGVLTNIVIPVIFNNSNFSKYGPTSLLVFLIFTGYSIFKYHLFEIKIIISQILITTLTISLFIYIILSKDYLEFLTSIILFILFIFVAIRLSKVIKQSIQRSKDLERTTKILSKNIESKDIFLRMTSHQLRTPITSLNGLVIMALENWDTKKKMNIAARRDLLLVYLNIQRLGEIVNDVLAVNAINADRFGISIREKVDIEDELKFMVEEKSYFIEYYNVKIYINIKKGKDFYAIVDLMRLRGVFTNILNNAIFYGKGKIWINLYDLGDEVKIEFIDNGIGIESKDLERIWKKAYRSKRALYRNPNGSGLGLFISRIVINLHQGSIIAESKGADTGSKFSIILPKTQK